MKRRHPQLVAVVSVNDMWFADDVDTQSGDARARSTEVIHRVVRHRTPARLPTLRHAEIESHVAGLEERHGLAVNLKQELESEDLAIESDGAVNISNRNVQLSEAHVTSLFVPDTCGVVKHRSPRAIHLEPVEVLRHRQSGFEIGGIDRHTSRNAERDHPCPHIKVEVFDLIVRVVVGDPG